MVCVHRTVKKDSTLIHDQRVTRYLFEEDLAVSIDRFMNSCSAFSLASISDISAE